MVIAIALVGLACGSGKAGTATKSTAQGAGQGGADPIVITVPDAGPGGDMAALGGTLRDNDGCLAVETAAGTMVTPLFPHGTYWDTETGALPLPNGDTFTLGERVTMAGGEPDNRDSASFEPAPECLSTDLWTVYRIGPGNLSDLSD